MKKNLITSLAVVLTLLTITNSAVFAAPYRQNVTYVHQDVYTQPAYTTQCVHTQPQVTYSYTQPVRHTTVSYQQPRHRAHVERYESHNYYYSRNDSILGPVLGIAAVGLGIAALIAH